MRGPVKENDIISELTKFGVLRKTFKTTRPITLYFYLSLTLELFLNQQIDRIAMARCV